MLFNMINNTIKIENNKKYHNISFFYGNIEDKKIEKNSDYISNQNFFKIEFFILVSKIKLII